VSGPSYRPEFLAALDLLARASRVLEQAGKPLPILVGGAVVEFDTMSAVTTGDLDVVSADQAALGEALEAVGFRPEDRQGRRLGGWYHPDLPIAVDCVASRYYEGRAERQRVRVYRTEGGTVRMAPIEELLVDRIGQWEASDRKDAGLYAQIANLTALADALDVAYVRRRVAEEIGVAPDLTLFQLPGTKSP
jgi:hypothetical protein